MNLMDRIKLAAPLTPSEEVLQQSRKGERKMKKIAMTGATGFIGSSIRLMKLPAGVYNLASENHRTTYEAAVYMAEQFGYSQEEIAKYIRPNYDRYKERFRDYRLSAAKLRAAGIELGNLETDLEMCLRDFGWLRRQK